MLLMVGKGWREGKAIETVQFTSVISLPSLGSLWKVSRWLGTSTPWHAWTSGQEGWRSPWWLLHSGALLFSVSCWQMKKEKCVKVTFAVGQTGENLLSRWTAICGDLSYLSLCQSLNLVIPLCWVLPVPEAKSLTKIHTEFMYVHYS